MCTDLTSNMQFITDHNHLTTGHKHGRYTIITVVTMRLAAQPRNTNKRAPYQRQKCKFLTPKETVNLQLKGNVWVIENVNC